MSLSVTIRLTLLAALLLLTACAVPPLAQPAGSVAVVAWHGRLALRVEADADAASGQTQSVTASFELSGDPQQGALTLYTPLGTTTAQLDWSAQSAVLRRNGEARHFASLADLIGFALGTEVPVAALFAWLAGEPVAAAGWKPDLSRHATGHILARRAQPAPAAEIHLVLEK